jgi:hypothetical protein
MVGTSNRRRNTMTETTQTQFNALNTPWSLHFDRDGTENIAVIRDADGEELVTSRPFWLPAADDAIPATLAALRLMVVAPKLLHAALGILAAQEGGTIDFDLLRNAVVAATETDA